MKNEQPNFGHRPLAVIGGRYGLYTLILLVLLLTLPKLIQHSDIAIFRENGPLEWFQFSVLLVTSGILLIGTRRNPACRQWFLVVALGSSLACVRELDSVFDALLSKSIGWQLPASIVVAGAAYTIWKNPRGFLAQADSFVGTRGFGLLWAGFAVATLFSQLVGHGDFLETLMGDDYVRSYKRVIEELGELFGYGLLLIGSIEMVIDVRKVQAGEPQGSTDPRQ